MYKLTVLLLAILSVAEGFAAEGGYPLQKAVVAVNNKPALQRGAKYFVNYCLSCHSARFSRYSRIGQDLGLTPKMVKENLIFTREKINDPLKVSMTDEEGNKWFGAAPPDLTLISRARGSDWIYTYLKSFYLDESRPLGVNNAVFPNVSMPHVLWDLQGWQKANFVTTKDEDGNIHKTVTGFVLVEPGKLSPEEYDKVLSDLVSFLYYLAEPSAALRKAYGPWVILFLIFLGVLAYFLKKEYWKDVK